MEKGKEKETNFVAIDNGYWNTKVLSKDNQFIFESKVERNDNPITSVDSDIITYNNVKYLVGKGAGQFDIARDKTEDEIHKICTYNALARLTGDKVTEYNLILGLPVDQYKNELEREKFIKYIKGNGPILINTEDNKDKLFSIQDVKIFPQCAGVLYSSDTDKYAETTVGIIDIGGGTAQGCIFNELNLVANSDWSYDLGMHFLLNDIRKELNSKLGLNLQEHNMLNIFKNGVNGKNKSKSIEIINSKKVEHVKKIRKAIIENHWELESMDLLLTGGGCIHLKSELTAVFPTAKFTADPLNDNAKGFYNVGLMIYEENI